MFCSRGSVTRSWVVRLSLLALIGAGLLSAGCDARSSAPRIGNLRDAGPTQTSTSTPGSVTSETPREAALATSAAPTSAGGQRAPQRSSSAESGEGRSGVGQGTKGSSATRTAGARESDLLKKTGYIIIKYWNDTVSREPNLVVVAGNASWRPRKGVASEQGKLGPVPIGRTIDLLVYPDGTNGTSVVVPVLLTERMSSNELDAIHIEVRDSRVRILGNPVEQADIVVARP